MNPSGQESPPNPPSFPTKCKGLPHHQPSFWNHNKCPMWRHIPNRGWATHEGRAWIVSSCPLPCGGHTPTNSLDFGCIRYPLPYWGHNPKRHSGIGTTPKTSVGCWSRKSLHEKAGVEELRTFAFNADTSPCTVALHCLVHLSMHACAHSHN